MDLLPLVPSPRGLPSPFVKATVDATGAATLTVPLANLTLTKYAAGLAVVAGNGTGSAGPSMAATVEIKDYCALVIFGIVLIYILYYII